MPNCKEDKIIWDYENIQKNNVLSHEDNNKLIKIIFFKLIIILISIWIYYE
jgi:hypothetical protein